MILLDTNVIIDLLSDAVDREAAWSVSTYSNFASDEPLVCNHVVLAEIAAKSHQRFHVLDDLERLRIELLPLTTDSAFASARAYGVYRDRGGKRDAILADFLVAGHAEALGASLMTRDRRLGFYFPNLPLISPETHPHD